MRVAASRIRCFDASTLASVLEKGGVRIEMKPIHIVRIVLGIVALVGIVYFIGKPREMAPVVIYKATRLTAETETPARHSKRENNAPPSANVSSVETTADAAPARSGSAAQRLKTAMASPAYLEYSRKQAERVGFNIVLWWEFLEAAGIEHNGRQLQAEAFEKYFPGGDYADYEPMMRLAVAELFLEDPDASVMDVLQRFNAERPNRVWRFGYFNGYEGEYEWGERIKRDAVDIFANAITREETFQGPAFSEFSPDTEVPAIGTASEAETFEPLTGPPDLEENRAFATPEPLPETFKEFEAEFLKRFTVNLPDLPSDTDLETTLDQQFSPERLNTAMQTLYRYGPQDGLRHLKTTDPEAAAHFERYLHPNAKTDESLSR